MRACKAPNGWGLAKIAALTHLPLNRVWRHKARIHIGYWQGPLARVNLIIPTPIKREGRLLMGVGPMKFVA